MFRKLVLDLFLILVNSPKQGIHASNSKKKDILKEDSEKSFKKLTDVIIIPILSGPLNLENMERKRKNYKYLIIWRTKRAFSMKLKAFPVIFEIFCFGKTLKK